VVEPAGADGVARLDVDVTAADAAEQRRIADSVAGEVDPGQLEVRVGGRIATLLAAEDTALDGLWRLELLVVPLAALALAAGVGVRLMAGPLLCAAIAVTAALAGLGLAGLIMDLSLLGTVSALGVGLAGVAGALSRALARGRLRALGGLLLAVALLLVLGVSALDAQAEPLAEAARRPLAEQLPVVALAAGLALALVFAARPQSVRAIPFALVPLLPPAAALGVATLVSATGPRSSDWRSTTPDPPRAAPWRSAS